MISSSSPETWRLRRVVSPGHEGRLRPLIVIGSRAPLDCRVEIDCPCNWWLDAPLGERVVIDVDTGEELPLYIPRWYLDKPDLYVPRPPGVLWPPEDMPRAG